MSAAQSGEDSIDYFIREAIAFFVGEDASKAIFSALSPLFEPTAKLFIGIGLLHELFILLTPKRDEREGESSGNVGRKWRRQAESSFASESRVVWFVYLSVMHCWVDYVMAFYRGDSILAELLRAISWLDTEAGLDRNGDASIRSMSALVLGPLCLLVAYGSALQERAKWRMPMQVMATTLEVNVLMWRLMGSTALKAAIVHYYPISFDESDVSDHNHSIARGKSITFGDLDTGITGGEIWLILELIWLFPSLYYLAEALRYLSKR